MACQLEEGSNYIAAPSGRSWYTINIIKLGPPKNRKNKNQKKLIKLEHNCLINHAPFQLIKYANTKSGNGKTALGYKYNVISISFKSQKNCNYTDVLFFKTISMDILSYDNLTLVELKIHNICFLIHSE